MFVANPNIKNGRKSANTSTKNVNGDRPDRLELAKLPSADERNDGLDDSCCSSPVMRVPPQVAQSGRRDIDRRCHSYLALAGQATQFTLYSCEQRVRNHSCFSGSIHGSYCQMDHIGTGRSDPMTLPSDIGGSLSWVELCTDSRLASSGIPISGFLRRPSRRTLRV